VNNNWSSYERSGRKDLNMFLMMLHMKRSMKPLSATGYGNGEALLPLYVIN